MTRQEAIDILRVITPPRESKRIFDEFMQARDMAIKALEEPSKTGEWNMYYDDDAPQDGIWLCSVCGYAKFVDDISPQNFCPQCGARMLNGR